jgi:tight adherence protein B
VIALALSLLGAYGVFLVYTALALGWSGVGVSPRVTHRARRRRHLQDLLVQAGLGDVRPAELSAVVAVLFAAGAFLGWAVFGGPLAALVAGAFLATVPVAAARRRRQRRLAEARDAWPRMIEEIRLLTSSAGRSIPQALFSVGERGPVELRPAFADARREWLLSTDFARTAGLLKERLADPTADAALETLLVAHEIGGSDVDRRLAALIDDRIADVQGRKDARAKQAGVRFARKFVLAVPLGMAVVGLTIGNGRASYQTPAGQVAVLVGLLLLAACWFWAGLLLRLPEEERVFSG